MQNEPMTTEQMEAYLRARWKRIEYYCLGASVWIYDGDTMRGFRLSDSVSFTKQREQEIAELEEEIEELQMILDLGSQGIERETRFGRTLARVNRELAELRKGWIG